MQKRTTSSVAHHLLASYQRAHIAIIKAQFTSKRLANGMSVRLLRMCVVRPEASRQMFTSAVGRHHPGMH